MNEPEYADFSDMQNPELPDEVPQDNIEHQKLDYFEEPQETQPQEEEVKPEPKAEKENPESFKYFQSLADKRYAELLAEKQKREQLEREIEQYKAQLSPKKEEPLTPPVPPRSDDPLEEIRYAKEYAEYINKVNEQRFNKVDAYFQQLEAERQARIQQEQLAQQRAWQVSQLTQAGLSPEEASQALVEFSKDAETPEQYFKDLAEFYRFRKGLTNPKASKVEQRAIRQGAIPPLGVMPSEVEPQKIDPSDEFFDDMKGFISKNF